MPAGPKQATVETLTAEVRVLMVGSRQVTLSVARQLDWVDAEVMEPFGRVRISNVGDVDVIGRRRADGALVRASIPQPSPYPRVLADELPGVMRLCWCLRPHAIEVDRLLSLNGRTFVIGVRYDTPHVEWRSREEVDWHDPNRCTVPWVWMDSAVPDHIRKEIAAWDAEIAFRRTLLALPLIVLAGLR